VLIIDDEPDIHAVVKMCVKNEKVNGAPIEVLTANSKQSALSLIHQFEHEIALIFLDVIMETDNAGFEFLAELRTSGIYPQPQVILLTGQAGLGSERNVSKQHEINAYLSKTDMNPYRIVSLLNTCIRNFETIKQLEKATLELKVSQQQQAESHHYIKSILNALSDALIVVNDEGSILSVNPAVKSIFGYDDNELIGKPIEVLMPEPFASKHSQYMEQYAQTGKSHIMGRSRELPAVNKFGKTFPMELTLTEVNTEQGQLYIGLIRNISERIEAQQEIYQLAYFDNVTNLPNLDNFYKHLTKDIEQKKPTNDFITLALVDLSGFYRINQAYGHDVGDQILSLLVDRMEWAIPKYGKLFRAEGTDFIVQLKSKLASVDELQKEITDVAKNLHETINQDIYLGPIQHNILAHIGILIAAANDIVTTKVLHQLEFATTRSKLINETRYEFYQSELEQESMQRFKLEQEMAKAIEKDEFTLFMQPQFNKDRKLICSEALIRWNSSELGFISPADFIPIAEETGLIVRIGRWVLNQVCQYLAELNAQQISTSIAINLSARELLQPDFVDTVINTINQHNIEPKQITLEVTESVFATDIETVIDAMKQLHRFGLRFSIDDFGTGYSSLSYLRRLPINELKIDKSFIDDITDSNSHAPLVETIIKMAKSFNLQIVAEGVELDCQMDYLCQYDNMLIQGYLLSKPLPHPDWHQFLVGN
jgi:PAS domain S-box-containing protein/diguanylate cyclase (GGDEF)-like protein